MPTINSPKITTTIDIETPSIEVEVIEDSEAPTPTSTNPITTTANQTDWSTVLPTRWYPRRKQASSAENLETSSSFLKVSIIVALLLLYLV